MSSTLSIIPDNAAGEGDEDEDDKGKNHSTQQIVETCATSNVEIPSTTSAFDLPMPTKLLNALSPVPLTFGASNIPSKRKQSVQNLTGISYIAEKKEKVA